MKSSAVQRVLHSHLKNFNAVCSLQSISVKLIERDNDVGKALAMSKYTVDVILQDTYIKREN
jgi:hypothetical protein